MTSQKDQTDKYAGIYSSYELIIAADRIASRAVKDKMSALEKEIGPPDTECSRCQGKGWAHFMGSYNPPGRCFKCWGTGTVYVGEKKKKHYRASLEAEVVRLRMMYRAARLARVLAVEEEAAAARSSRRWTAYGTVAGIDRNLASYEDAGKRAVAELADLDKKATAKKPRRR